MMRMWKTIVISTTMTMVRMMIELMVPVMRMALTMTMMAIMTRMSAHSPEDAEVRAGDSKHRALYA